MMMVEKGINICVAGVYAIKSKSDNKVRYIGSAVECNDAYSRHASNLKFGKYYRTNKEILERYFYNDDLIFTILRESASNNEIKLMDKKQKDDLQIALSRLEMFYINLYANMKDSCICNAQFKVTKSSSNKNKFSTYKRSQANQSINNPRYSGKLSEEIVSYILFFKQLGYKNRHIVKILEDNGIEFKMDTNYISRLGVDRYVAIKAIKPEWFNEVDYAL